MRANVILAILAIAAAATGSPVAADPNSSAQSIDDGRPRGPVTNLPIPRFVSLKAAESNVRRGPSLTHRVDWVFKYENMPLEVTGEFENWRRVRDRDGQGGWVHYSLLSGVRTVIVEEDMAPLYAKPDPATPVKAYAETGVIARLGACISDWCRITAKGARGWIRKASIWGVAADELRE